ncbi:MAG: BatA domain-containing protein [Pirellulaceae bacterium]
MSLLAPLYALGALAIALPIVFHLIRRRPKAEAQFSSLMFLSPSPPRLTRKSRLDQWPLLLLRALAIALIALAFARPFWRSSASRPLDAIGRRVVVLLDTSGSMRRSDLWEQSRQQLTSVIEASTVNDQLALMAFDSEVRTIVPFDSAISNSGTSQTQRLLDAVDSMQPGYAQSRLGAALIEAADLLLTTGDSSEQSASIPSEIVIISDLQSGCDLTPLQTYQWPESITVSIAAVTAAESGNLSATVLPQIDTAEERRAPQLRVRFTNTSDAVENQFMYFWDDDPDSQDHVVQVPAGQSRVVKVDIPPSSTGMLRFVGDSEEFDNQVHVVLPRKVSQEVVYIGPVVDEQNPLDDLFYFLRQVTLGDFWRTVGFTRAEAMDASRNLDPSDTPLVILSGSLEEPTINLLKRYLSDGGNVLFVLDQSSSGYAAIENTIRDLSDGSTIEIADAEVGDYAMLEKIDFADPIFRPFDDPKFNDFTRVRFWKHRQLVVDSSSPWRTIASFDDGNPALLQQEIGNGRMMLLAAGWQPQQSQLALSSKFVPLLAGMMLSNRPSETLRSGYDIGEDGLVPMELPGRLTSPDGSTQTIEDPLELKSLKLPGIYRFAALNAARDQSPAADDDSESNARADVDSDADAVSFALNLPASESQTVPLAQEDLEKFGISLQRRQSTEEIEAARRQLQDVELESRQRIWQWLIVLAIGILFIETLLATHLARKQQALP